VSVFAVNTFAISVSEDDPYEYSKGSAAAIYGPSSFFNHSCVPNASYSFKKIKKNQEIFVSYVADAETDKEKRQRLSAYGFICQCTKCAKNL
jgi:hypothetical protein